MFLTAGRHASLNKLLTPRLALPAILVLTSGIFILDLHTPLGFADGILYLLPLLLTTGIQQRHLPFRLATVFTGLILLGAFLSPPGASIETWGTNRVMSIVGVWATAAFLAQRKRAEEATQRVHDKLEEQIQKRTEFLVQANQALYAQVAERIKTEGALRESEERFRLLMGHANDAIFYIDLNGTILWASHQSAVMTGWPSDRLIGRLIMELLSPKSAAVAAARLAAVRRGEAVPPLVEIEFLRPDGLMIWGEANITSVAEGGKVVGRLVVARDITDRKVADEALRQSERQLRQLLDDRERISRDLHDNIIQTIYAIGLSLEESQRLIEEDSKTAAENLSDAIKDLNVVIRDVRSYIAWTEPTIMNGQQLRAAITKLARTMEGTNLLHFRLKLKPGAADRLTPEEAGHVLYIVREAMSNSLRHSNARDGIVSLQVNDGNVCLVVADAGDGFDTTDTGRYGQGLHNMAVRAQKMDARLQVLSEPGLGVRIMLDVPTVRKRASI